MVRPTHDALVAATALWQRAWLGGGWVAAQAGGERYDWPFGTSSGLLLQRYTVAFSLDVGRGGGLDCSALLGRA